MNDASASAGSKEKKHPSPPHLHAEFQPPKSPRPPQNPCGTGDKTDAAWPLPDPVMRQLGGGGGGGVGFAGRGGAAARDRYLGFMKMIGMPGTGSPVNWVWDGPEEMGEFFGVSWYCTAPPPPPPPHNSPVLSTVGWGYNVACPGLSVIICLQTMN